MTLFMLDTDTVSFLVHRRSAKLMARVNGLGVDERMCISAITEGELRYGVARKPEDHQLAAAVALVLSNLEILPWNSEAAAAYGWLRAENQRRGLAAGNLDLLIAAHAVACKAVLVTNGHALMKLAGGLVTVNWADNVTAK